MNKILLRKLVKEKLNNITNKSTKDKKIFLKIIHLEEFEKSKNILIYINNNIEISTKEIIEYCFKVNKRVYIPFIKKLAVGEIKSFHELIKVNKYYEPLKESALKKVDLAIIPGLAFDKNKNRLGQGKGWYDKFLSLNSKIFKIGICYKEQIIEEIETNDLDIKMDLIITD